MKPISQIDIAPTIARTLGFEIKSDGAPIKAVEGWQCRNAILIIVDSLGYDLYQRMKPRLSSMPALADEGFLFRARSVSNHTSPAIASILSGLLPEHHHITDTKAARHSPLLSIPEIATSAGLRSAVVMEKEGAMVYEELIEFIGAVPGTLIPLDFDKEACRLSLDALSSAPRLLVSYFIGIDKAAHNSLPVDGFMKAVVDIDGYIGKIVDRADRGTMIVIVGDHPVHAGPFKRTHGPYCVPILIGKKV